MTETSKPKFLPSLPKVRIGNGVEFVPLNKLVLSMESKHPSKYHLEGFLNVMKCKNCSTPEALYKCEGCHMVRYCCRECQLADWANHKPFCDAHKNSRIPRPRVSFRRREFVGCPIKDGDVVVIDSDGEDGSDDDDDDDGKYEDARDFEIILEKANTGTAEVEKIAEAVELTRKLDPEVVTELAVNTTEETLKLADAIASLDEIKCPEQPDDAIEQLKRIKHCSKQIFESTGHSSRMVFKYLASAASVINSLVTDTLDITSLRNASVTICGYATGAFAKLVQVSESLVSMLTSSIMSIGSAITSFCHSLISNKLAKSCAKYLAQITDNAVSMAFACSVVSRIVYNPFAKTASVIIDTIGEVMRTLCGGVSLAISALGGVLAALPWAEIVTVIPDVASQLAAALGFGGTGATVSVLIGLVAKAVYFLASICKGIFETCAGFVVGFCKSLLKAAGFGDASLTHVKNSAVRECVDALDKDRSETASSGVSILLDELRGETPDSLYILGRSFSVGKNMSRVFFTPVLFGVDGGVMQMETAKDCVRVIAFVTGHNGELSSVMYSVCYGLLRSCDGRIGGNPGGGDQEEITPEEFSAMIQQVYGFEVKSQAIDLMVSDFFGKANRMYVVTHNQTKLYNMVNVTSLNRAELKKFYNELNPPASAPPVPTYLHLQQLLDQESTKSPESNPTVAAHPGHKMSAIAVAGLVGVVVVVIACVCVLVNLLTNKKDTTEGDRGAIKQATGDKNFTLGCMDYKDKPKVEVNKRALALYAAAQCNRNLAQGASVGESFSGLFEKGELTDKAVDLIADSQAHEYDRVAITKFCTLVRDTKDKGQTFEALSSWLQGTQLDSVIESVHFALKNAIAAAAKKSAVSGRFDGFDRSLMGDGNLVDVLNETLAPVLLGLSGVYPTLTGIGTSAVAMMAPYALVGIGMFSAMMVIYATYRVKTEMESDPSRDRLSVIAGVSDSINRIGSHLFVGITTDAVETTLAPIIAKLVLSIADAIVFGRQIFTNLAFNWLRISAAFVPLVIRVIIGISNRIRG